MQQTNRTEEQDLGYTVWALGPGLMMVPVYLSRARRRPSGTEVKEPPRVRSSERTERGAGTVTSLIASFTAVALLSGLVGAGVALWADDSGGSQTAQVVTTRQGTSSSRSERALKAETARWDAQARYYLEQERNLARSRRAETERWEAAAAFHRGLNDRR